MARPTPYAPNPRALRAVDRGSFILFLSFNKTARPQDLTRSAPPEVIPKFFRPKFHEALVSKGYWFHFIHCPMFQVRTNTLTEIDRYCGGKGFFPYRKNPPPRIYDFVMDVTHQSGRT